MNPLISSIVVAGDVCIDWLSIPVTRVVSGATPPAVPPANWQLRDGLRMLPRAGGAWLLAELVAHATGQPVMQQPVPKPLEHQGCDCALHSMLELKPFPRSNSDKDRKDAKGYVWRVDRFRGFAGPDSPASSPCQVPVHNDEPGAKLIVLDDVGNGFRHDPAVWPKALEQVADEKIILWKLARPLGESALAQRLLAQHRDRTVVVLDVDDLRAEGASISRQLSWERTASDVIHALANDRRFSQLRAMAHLVVRLDLEAALHVSRLDTTSDGKPARLLHSELTYQPDGIEGATRGEIPGDMLGFTSGFVARLAAELAQPGAASLDERIRHGIQSGLATTRRLFQQGFGPASAPPADLRSAVLPVTGARMEFVTLNVAPLVEKSFIPRLLDHVRQSPLEVLAGKIVLEGIKSALPAAPVAKFGKLETLDRTEIETFRSIRNLIREYLSLPAPERPLSIAVFGPPGSGKSFGVAEVAKSLGDVEKIEFNVSQFEGARQLTAAFHVVRDAVVRGRVPLVFFDEFDAEGHGHALGWLKHFLAPMQDGKFADGESTHLIGRAIFIFAGGTRHTFGEFARLTEKDFREAKGPDFVSRLRGHIDVRGTDRREPEDTIHVIRRAVLLRSLLQRKAPALFDAAGLLRLDAGVLRAFLRCGTFRHGARSMEAVIDMSLLAGREAFERSSLPGAQQLDLHVDAAEFMKLVKQDVTLNEHREKLARAIHERFLHEQTGRKPATDPSMQPWATLPENYRRDNFDQADDIARKLVLTGCDLQEIKEDDGLQRLVFGPEEIELLAQAEHDRWNASKRQQGYTYAPGDKRDVEPRTHPCLLPWSELPEHERDKDRITVRAIPEFLETAGFRVIKLP